MFVSGKWSYSLVGRWLIFLALLHSPFSFFLKDPVCCISGLANVLQGPLDYILFGVRNLLETGDTSKGEVQTGAPSSG